MRQYRYQATDETIAALRHLQGAWTAYRVEPRTMAVWLADGHEVRITVDRADVEPALEAFRLSATVVGGPTDRLSPDVDESTAPLAAPVEQGADFALGGNQVLLVTGATWSDGPPGDGEATSGAPPAVQFSGSPGQVAETATAVCLTTDALVAATPLGTGFLVRTGVQPYTLHVTDDAGEIAEFLRGRGYGAE